MKFMDIKRYRFGRKIRFYYGRRTCAYCGYTGSDWKDTDECPACGEIN